MVDVIRVVYNRIQWISLIQEDRRRSGLSVLMNQIQLMLDEEDLKLLKKSYQNLQNNVVL